MPLVRIIGEILSRLPANPFWGNMLMFRVHHGLQCFEDVATIMDAQVLVGKLLAKGLTNIVVTLAGRNITGDTLNKGESLKIGDKECPIPADKRVATLVLALPIVFD